ncbi:MAG: anti-sigma factor domain-containing protein [Burkholderiales bacterium]
MNLRGKPELQDRLAAEYVLGTLRGRARQRFEVWMRDDAALRRTVSEWQERLAPMAAAVPPIRPPRRVWQGIESRLRQGGGKPVATRRSTTWDSLPFWRNWGLAAAGFAAALVGAMAFVMPAHIRDEVDRGIFQAVAEASKKMQPSYIAILEDTKGNVRFVAYAARTADELWVKNVGMESLPSGQRYELWGLSARQDVAPKSLGLVPITEKGTMKLAAVADKSLTDFPKLAISLERAGGSPTGLPTGPVMYVGDCHNFW